MFRISFVSCLLSLCMIMGVNQDGQAAWPVNPTVNVPVCTASYEQGWDHTPGDAGELGVTELLFRYSPVITSDGSRGAIIVWWDRRNKTQGDSYEIYAQRIDVNGNILWAQDGVAVCTTGGDQIFPAVVGDGAGGAIIAWQDKRNGADYDIYAQRINANGVPVWQADGIPICTSGDDQKYATIISDGAGGAIIAWHDEREASYNDIYAQRVDANGNVLWQANGVAICVLDGYKSGPVMVSDGAGGAIIAFADNTSLMIDGNPTSWNILAQRVNANGTTLWGDSAYICTEYNDQDSPLLVSDGAGGAIIAWEDARPEAGGDGNKDIYAQRVDANGNVLWQADGVAICTAASWQANPILVSDGASGAIIAWEDFRNSNSPEDIYAQRVNANGQVQWQQNGVHICISEKPTMISDEEGGAIIAWHDNRNGPAMDIYAQRINGNGQSLWAPNGATVCTADNIQKFPVIVKGGPCAGAIIAWEDGRNGSTPDIYAQNICRYDGSLPVELSLLTATTSPAGDVILHWRTESEVNSLGFNIYRSDTKGGKYTKVNAKLVAGTGTDATPHDYSFTDESVVKGFTYYYYIESINLSGETNRSHIIEITVGKQSIKTHLIPLQFSLLQNYPNPFNPETWFPYELAEDTNATIYIYDVNGQLVRQLDLGLQKAGSYIVKGKAARWDGKDQFGQPVSSGLYFYMLKAGSFRAIRRMLILK